MKNGTLLAALDLGSNSFRLEIGRLDNGQIHRTEYLKETVRQGNGLDAERMLSQEAMQRGWDCLARFAERLAGFERHQVRAVATQTLREARNRQEFLDRAAEILGFHVDVIPGREEARLIYQGVAQLLPQSDERRLVVDIGGRSTELILGQGYEAETTESYRVGSVSWSMHYFPDGLLTPETFRVAEIAAKAVLDEAISIYRPSQWDTAYGASGTVGAVADVLNAAGWPKDTIDRHGLNWIMEQLLKAGHVDKLRLEGIKDDRRLVIGGGISILYALFDLLGIEQMQAADGALRHGVLYDLVQREQVHTDLRAATVNRLAEKFDTDAAQMARVQSTATLLYGQLQHPAGVPTDGDVEFEQAQRKLAWAAQLHEIGSHISHSDYHRHGAYILENAHAPGFSLPELHRLSQLVLGHRGKLRKLEIDLLDPGFIHQLLALRLSVILCHARRDPEVAGLQLAASPAQKQKFVLSCPDGWADAYPQSAHLLREEVAAWQKTPWTLLVTGV
ncbi:exopolyphosphatase [Variovorax sp. HJSM1_2]|uniref:Ppx/GppA phosphatase family protein n=1 Tax=Variovorax sp. HJSM1_2 TaxID=3366263 RepID=UPI003BE35049